MILERLPASRWRLLAGIVATALLIGLYARGGIAWMVGAVMLVPWLLALNATRTYAGTLASALLMSVAFVATTFYWFGTAIGGFTGIGALQGTAVLLVLAPVMQPQIVVFALLRHLAGRRHGAVLTAFAGASAWVACEWALPKLLGDTLGHGLFPSTLFRQAADLGGAAGLSFLLILVNEGVALAIARRGDGVRAIVRPLAGAIAIVLAVGGYGAARLPLLQVAPASDAPTLRVAMVQASITDYERLRQEIGAYGVVRKVLDTHFSLSQSAVRDHGADVLLWSETVYPTTFTHARSDDGAALDGEIQGFVDAVGVPLVFGTYDIDDDGEYNAAAFIEPGRGLLGFYRKTFPFPLTEHVPRWLDGPTLRRWLPWTGTWQAGNGARVLPLRSLDGREVNVVPLICLDDVQPGLAIDGARLGAQAIVGMSNDSWFSGTPAGARLHLSVAAFRSIETRLPQVRITTSGPSAIIDATGEVVASTVIGSQAVLTATLAAQDPAPTLMVRWGDWVGRAGAVSLLILAVLAAWRVLRQRQVLRSTVPFTANVVVLTRGWRVAASALRMSCGIGILWIGIDMLARTGLQVQSLSQLKLFVYGVVLPGVAAWSVGRLFATKVRIDDGALVLDQRRQRTEIPLASIAAVRPWRLPLPHSGVDLRLTSGETWPGGLSMADPVTLQQALVYAGSSARIEGSAGMSRFAHVRASAVQPWFDHALVKFVLFPLLPAAVAFRLHQMIAFGSPFGEATTYGITAWLTGALIWWASWSIGLMLFAAVLRIVIEALTAVSFLLTPTRALALRDALMWIGRAAFYLGVPIWLGTRLLSS